MTETKKKKVLSIDGGGVKGIIPARILQEIETRTSKAICELFDIITGTSTGGLLALGLTAPIFTINGNGVISSTPDPRYSATELVQFYLERSKEIFPKSSLIREIKTGFGLWGSKYDRVPLDTILEEVFNGTLLSWSLCPVFIPIYSLDHDKPFIASSIYARTECDFYMKDIAGATTAAPTYFDPKTFKSFATTLGHNYQGVDGGIYANNPELIGLTAVYIMHPDLDVDDIVLCSLGCGREIFSYLTQASIEAEGKLTSLDMENTLSETQPTNIRYSSDNGEIGWLKNRHIIDRMIDAESAIAETAITAMLKRTNHFRFQPTVCSGMIPRLPAMDDSSDDSLKFLLALAEDFITKNSNDIDNLCKELMENK